MTPEEYQRFKDAEKEHLKKLKELKQAVRVLERQKKIRSELEEMNRASDDVLQAQSDAVERLAMETAMQEARLEVAMDSAEDAESSPRDEMLEEELRAARAQALVERMKGSMSGPAGPETDADDATDLQEHGGRTGIADENPTTRARAKKSAPTRPEESRETPSTESPEARPEKTIGRM